MIGHFLVNIAINGEAKIISSWKDFYVPQPRIFFYSFITNEKLQRHVRIHTGEKPYKCNYCERAYCQSNELTKHLRNHLGDNVYQCELCPLRFPTVKIVREHYSTHKNDDEETKTRNLIELNAVELKGIYCR